MTAWLNYDNPYHHTATAKCYNHISCSISHQSVCNKLIIPLILRPPHNQPRSPTQHSLWKLLRDLKMEWLIELHVQARSPDAQKYDFMQYGHWVIHPLGRCLSNIHLVSFLRCPDHSIPLNLTSPQHSSICRSIFPLNQRVNSWPLSLSLSQPRQKTW